MTYAQDSSVQPEAYVGLDFGTSNTSISFVDQQSVNGDCGGRARNGECEDLQEREVD